MKVLLHHLRPFALGGDPWQSPITETCAALDKVDVEHEFLRWHDGKQTGDVLHFFGWMPSFLIPFAHEKKMKVVISEKIVTEGWPPPPLKRALIILLEKMLPAPVTSRLEWNAYRFADACVVASEPEKIQLNLVFRVPREKIHVIPPGDGPQLKALYEGLLNTSR